MVGERGLAKLLENRAVVLRLERVLDELLGDRRRALGGTAGDVRHERPRDPSDVDARIRQEALVLDRDDRGAHRRRDLVVVVEHDVIGWGEQSDRPPVVVIQVRVRRVLVLLAVLELRDIARDRHHHPEDRRDDCERGETEEDRQQPELAQPGSPRAASPTRAARSAPAPAVAGRLRRQVRPRGVRRERELRFVEHRRDSHHGSGG